MCESVWVFIEVYFIKPLDFKTVIKNIQITGSMRIQTIKTPNLYLPEIHDYYYNPHDPLLLPTYILSTSIGSRAREVHIEIVQDNYFQRYGLEQISISSLPLNEHEEAMLDELLPMRQSNRVMRTLGGSNYPDFIKKSLQQYNRLQRRQVRSDERRQNILDEKLRYMAEAFQGKFHEKLYLPI